MCTPTSATTSHAGATKDVATKKKTSTLSKCIATAFVAGAALIALAPAVLPILISETWGGWTTKYTSPHPVFATSDIGDLTGKVAIVTGSNTGVGYYSALELARANATVIVAARSAARGAAAIARVREEIDASPNIERADERVILLPLDLSSLESVEQFSRSFLKLGLPLHILMLNAGIMMSPGAQFVGQNLTYGFGMTEDGFESHIGVNHVGHFYLTKLLMDSLKESAPARVVSVSSIAEMGAYPEGMRFDLWRPDGSSPDPDYEDGLAYGQSKLANALFARELAARMEGTNVTAYSCHPGIIASELSRYMDKESEANAKAQGWLGRLVLRMVGRIFASSQLSAQDGALTQLQLATAPAQGLKNGAHYHPIGREVELMHLQGSNSTLQVLLWEETEKVLRSVGRSV